MNEGGRFQLHDTAAFVADLAFDGCTVMVGGFGEPGTPFYLLDALARARKRGLTVIKNDANEPGVGVGSLLRSGSIARLVASHIGLNSEAMRAMNDGEVEVELHPQGILAEKIRAGGAGLPAFLSDVGVGLLPEVPGSRERFSWRGRELFIESALRADVALLRAHAADSFGNLIYRKSARNFNTLMATAADRVVVEVERLEPEPFEPDLVMTPSCFVDALVVVPGGFDPGTKGARIRAGLPL